MTPFKDAYDRVEREIEGRYGIPVAISDVLDPNTGDFDGMKIDVDRGTPTGNTSRVSPRTRNLPRSKATSLRAY